MKCTHCCGRGTVLEYVAWSDGLGGVDAVCPLCDGSKDMPTVDAILKMKREGAAAGGQLRALKAHVALFLGTNDEGTAKVWPPLKGAPNPSPYRSTWRTYLERAASTVPRYTEAEVIERNGGGERGRLWAEWLKGPQNVDARDFARAHGYEGPF